jgi:hypothetical protein
MIDKFIQQLDQESIVLLLEITIPSPLFLLGLQTISQVARDFLGSLNFLSTGTAAIFYLAALLIQEATVMSIESVGPWRVELN